MMKSPIDFYRDSLALCTDLYNLTMCQAHWSLGRGEQREDNEAIFHLFFRKAPFKGSYAVLAGNQYCAELLNNLKFEKDDLDYLASLEAPGGGFLFKKEFLRYLKNLEFDIEMDAIPEGTVVFPREPLLRVRGNIIQCQLIETILLNIINFQTLIATKATRICQAAGGDPVMEFGLRRAQGIDGGLSATRAAYIGGCSATSNVLAGKLFGIPVAGTHAHSWVMSFDAEKEAFEQYALHAPGNCTLLVDTYDTIIGVKKVLGLNLNKKDLRGIRLDSGDLLGLSIETRKLLDCALYVDTKIIASNDLDEYKIEELKKAGAKIDIWGVGTNLVTGADQPALGGVYKLARFGSKDCLKLSEDPDKTTLPGPLNVIRWRNSHGVAIEDSIIYDGETDSQTNDYSGERLLKPLFKYGRICQNDSLEAIRNRKLSFIQNMKDSYPVNISKELEIKKNSFLDERKH